jgi:hypothetical protein
MFLPAVCVSATLGCGLILGLQEPTIDNSIETGVPDSSTEGGTEGGGVCTKDCLGGACVNGVCQPVMLAQNQGGPVFLAGWGPRVYWANFVGNSVMSADKVDASTTLLVASGNGADQPFGIDTDDAGVYFANYGNSGTIMRCPLDGCPTPYIMYDGGALNSDLHVVNSFVYFLQSDFNELDRMPAAGGAVTPIGTTDTAGFDDLFSRIATDGNTIFWSEVDNDIIRRKPVGGGSATTLFTLPGLSAPCAILLDGAILFFATLGTDNATGTINYGNANGSGTVQTLADSQHYPFGLAVDATYVYWTTEGDFDSKNNLTAPGGVFRCAKTGCGGAPEQLASGVHDGRGIVVDDTAIYFVSYETGTGDGKIWRLAK